MAQVVTNENMVDLIQNRSVPEFKPPEPVKPEAEVAKEAAPEKVEQPRDEEGKFAPKDSVQEPAKEPEQAAQAADDDDDNSQLSEQVRKKIDRIIAKKHRAMKEAEEFARDEARRALAAEARAAELERQIQELRKGSEVKSDGPAPDGKPEGKPKMEDFKTVGEYAEAVADWKVREALRKEREESAKKEQQKRAEGNREAFEKRVRAVSEQFPDYQDVVGSLDAVVPQHIAMYIVEDENGPAMAYYLAKHRDEFDRIAKLSPIKALAEIGKLETKWLAKPEGKPAAAAPAVSKAPPPISPIEGKTVPVVKDPKDMTFAELRAYRESQKREGKWRAF